MTANAPLLNFRFRVEWGGGRVGFTQVEGLSAETEVAYYREGADKTYTPRAIPTLTRYSDVTLRRGIAAGDNDLYAWFHTVEALRTERRDVTISLLNEDHEAVVRWRLKDAFLRRIEGPTLSGTGEGGGIAIECMVLAHEGLVVENG